MFKLLIAFTLLNVANAKTDKQSKEDFYNLKSARYIAQIDYSLRRSSVSKRKLRDALKTISKSTLFKHYSNDLKLVSNIKNDLKKDRYFTCSTPGSGKNKIHTRFKSNLYKYCMNAYTLLINQKFEKVLMKNTDDLDKAILFYISTNNRSFLKKLDGLDKNSKLYNYSKAQIISTILEHGISPDKSLYTHIDFNTGLTSLLQSRLHSIKRNKLIFTQEFVKLYNEFKTVIHAEKVNKAKVLSEQLLSFHQENKKYIYNKTAWKRLVIAGKKLLRRKEDESARRVFRQTISTSYDNESYNEAIFQLLWTSIYKSDYKSTLEDIEKLKLIDKYPELNSKVKFWIAFVFHKNGDNSIATHLFKLIIKNNPLSYYSILAQKHLPSYNAKTSRELYLKKRDIASDNLTLQDFNKTYISDIREFFVWKKLNYVGKTDLLLQDFVSVSPKKLITNVELLQDYDNEELTTMKFKFFMKLFKANKDFLSSFKYISKSIDNNEVSTSMININNLFPTLYSDIIENEKTGLDVNFVLSLIRQESAFNPTAKSSVGARGLMQLMPSTAKRLVSYKRKDELFNPDLNIKGGTMYLKKLLNNFDGNIVLALSSYNAGPNKVKRWMNGIFSSNDPIFMIEEIPYRETKLYVKLIYRNLFFYSLLNNKYLLDDNLKSTFKVTMNKESTR